MDRQWLWIAVVGLAAGCGPPSPPSTGVLHACDESTFVCVSYEDESVYPTLWEAACTYCEADPNATPEQCEWPEFSHDWVCDDEPPDWSNIADAYKEQEGFTCVSAGVVHFPLICDAWNIDGTPAPACQVPLEAAVVGTWQDCSWGAESAETLCQSQCELDVATLIEAVVSTDFYVAGFGGALTYWGNNNTVNVAAYCDAVITGWNLDDDTVCFQEMGVGSPQLRDVVWSDGRTVPLDCHLPATCCEHAGACDRIAGRTTRSVAAEHGTVSGTLTVTHALGTDTARVTGSAAWTLASCASEACPVYLEALDLDVAELRGSGKRPAYAARDLTLSLDHATMGGWRPDLGQIHLPGEAVLMSLATESCDVAGTAIGRLERRATLTRPVSGAVTRDGLTLSALREVDGVQIALELQLSNRSL